MPALTLIQIKTGRIQGKVLSGIVIECGLLRAGGISSMTLMGPGHGEQQGMWKKGEKAQYKRQSGPLKSRLYCEI